MEEADTWTIVVLLTIGLRVGKAGLSGAPTPQIIGCVVYNQERMECTWTETAEHRDLALYWTLQNSYDPDCCEWYPCPYYDASTHTCTWHSYNPHHSVYMDGYIYTLCLRSGHVPMSPCLHYTSVDTMLIAKPEPVTQLNYEPYDHHSIHLTWRAPTLYNHFFYRLNVTRGNSFSHSELARKTTRFTVHGLDPGREYTVSVEAIHSVYDKPAGFWSNATTIKIRTNIASSAKTYTEETAPDVRLTVLPKEGLDDRNIVSQRSWSHSSLSDLANSIDSPENTKGQWSTLDMWKLSVLCVLSVCCILIGTVLFMCRNRLFQHVCNMECLQLDIEIPPDDDPPEEVV